MFDKTYCLIEFRYIGGSMSIKFGSIIVLIVMIFVAKISIDNFNTPQSNDFKVTKLNTKLK